MRHDLSVIGCVLFLGALPAAGTARAQPAAPASSGPVLRTPAAWGLLTSAGAAAPPSEAPAVETLLLTPNVEPEGREVRDLRRGLSLLRSAQVSHYRSHETFSDAPRELPGVYLPPGVRAFVQAAGGWWSAVVVHDDLPGSYLYFAAGREDVWMPERESLLRETPALRDEEAVRAEVERRYPEDLRRAGIGGAPGFWIRLDGEGEVVEVHPRTSSGHPSLDEAGREVVEEMEFAASEGGWTIQRVRFEPERRRAPFR